LDSQAVGIVHPVASFRVNLARFPISVVPSGLRRAGLLLTPSLNPELSLLAAILPTSLPRLPLLDRFFCCWRGADSPGPEGGLMVYYRP
jgi:hypothetical protein